MEITSSLAEHLVSCKREPVELIMVTVKDRMYTGLSLSDFFLKKGR